MSIIFATFRHRFVTFRQHASHFVNKLQFSRIPTENRLGKPIEVLKKIIENKETESTELLYQEFQKQLPVYGFGDLQIKHLLMKFLSQQ